ncbi:MAG: AAA family ATPase, partial [Bacteroidota bacterium]
NEFYPAQLNRAFFRDKIVDKLYKALYLSQNTPIAIVGKEGVGRHTIVHESVFRYLEKNSQTDQQLISVWHLDPTRVIAGMSIVGHWQQRFEAIIKYLKEPFPNKDLSHKALIDNPIALLRIGKSAQNDMTLSDVLKPYLEKRELQVIIIATPEEWTVFQEQDRSFSNLFQVIRLAEPDDETAIQMVLEQRKILEKEHDVRISISAINQLLYLQRKYFKSKVLPGSVIRLLQQLAVKYKEDVVEADQVRSSFQAISGLQERIFDTAYTYEPGEIRQELARELIGQPHAVEVLADVVHLFKSKLNNKNKPIGSLLFIGPTGVGKTQAAKVLARYLLGSDDYLMRFDMNEYIDSSAPQRLIGDYYNPEGQLTGKVRYKPFGIVLFDEMEKAHPLVLDLLLQVLDDGRLTDSLGRMVDFTNTIIIMTSNLGADKVDRAIGIGQDQSNIDHIYRRVVENTFRPEFVNRIDKMVVFQSLGPEHIRGIAQLQVNDLLSRDGFVRRTTILNISNAAMSWVAQRGFDKKMGGRAIG